MPDLLKRDNMEAAFFHDVDCGNTAGERIANALVSVAIALVEIREELSMLREQMRPVDTRMPR